MKTIRSSPSDTKSTFSDRVRARFGLLPNLFRLAPETPEIAEKLFGFAECAYFDIPLPSVFKERLFVWLSRFCRFRYCIARHTGFLMGLGHAAGDPHAEPQSVEEVIRLLKRRLPHGSELDACISLGADSPSPLTEVPAQDSPLEHAVFALASHVFLQTEDAPRSLEALRRLLDGVRYQYLLVFLTFVRAAHYWTKVHPELELEDDIRQLLQTQDALAKCILNDPEAGEEPVSASILDELPELRQRADRAISLLVAIVDSSDDAIISKDLDGKITSWNPGAEKLFRYDARDAIGKNIRLLIPPDRLDEETTIIDRITRGERIEHCDTVRLRKDGTEVNVSLTISPVRDATGKIVGASKIAHDITERKEFERAVLDSEQRFRTLAGALEVQVQFRTQELARRNADFKEQSQQMEELSQRLLLTQEEERRHIARDLHDSTGHTLESLGRTLSQLAREAKRDSTMSEQFSDAEQLVNQLAREINTASYLLHPPLVDDCGLSSPLHWYVDGLAQRSGLKIDLQIPEDFERLPPEMEVAIFRVVQESLSNILRHSGSSTAKIRIDREGKQIVVEIQDRGKGMTPERLAEVQTHGAGVGIRGMRERLRPFHGELSIDSNALGTRIHATLVPPAHTEEHPAKLRKTESPPLLEATAPAD